MVLDRMTALNGIIFQCHLADLWADLDADGLRPFSLGARIADLIVSEYQILRLTAHVDPRGRLPSAVVFYDVADQPIAVSGHAP